MNRTLLDLLTAAGTDWVSGEAISQRLGISRAAVWKQIEALRSAGYEVEAAPRRGYRLAGRPDKLTAVEIQAGLTTERFGRTVEAHAQIGSTNERAKELGRVGAPEGLLVVAEEQTAGKGRLGRSWSTPPGRALALSLLLRPAIAPIEAPRLTLVAAVAVAEAVRAETGLDVGIKWPNDLYVDGRKLCGILTELEAEIERVRFVVLGIGLNVNQAEAEFPPDIRETATSLRREAGRPFDRRSLLRAILARLEARYAQFLAGEWPALRAAWRSLSVTLGRPVRVVPASGEPAWEGEALDVDGEGALLVRRPDGSVERVVAGEVSIRPARA
jgi:BirA family biotin operon repressor/biotin-[acetyl-CoA-carboxylase] ligase